MSETKHTPEVYSKASRWHELNYDGHTDTMAEWERLDEWFVAAGIDPEAIAKRLIAAAPELLAALEECAGELQYHERSDTGETRSSAADALDAARAAIAKAKGETE